MKLIKVLAPVLLSGFIALPAFAAEDQQTAPAAAQAQPAQADQQAANSANANAAGNQQLADSAASQPAEKDADASTSKAKKSAKCNCKRVHHKRQHHAARKSSSNEPQHAQADAVQGQQEAQEQAPAANQNS